MTNLKNKIKQDYIELSQKDKHIQALIKKFEDGKATSNDVDSITKATGHALKTALEKNIAENPAAFADEEILADILRETFGDNYELINAVAADVQKRLDKVQGINIKPQKAEFPEERVDNLAKFTAKQDLTRKKSVSEVGAAAENLNNSMYTDYVKANAEFRSRAGLKVYVIRTSDGNCCEWCDKLVGKYDYSDIPKDVWRRHKRCTCEITYVNEREGTYDRISFHDSIDPEDGEKLVTSKQVTKLTSEQAAAKEREILERKTLTFGRKSDIMNAEKISGALNPDSERAQEHAERYYEAVRHMKNDVQRISQNTGFDENEIAEIKRFIFMDKHDLGNKIDYFAPDYMMAQSWQRLIDGKNIQSHDVTLLNHERMERQLMKQGYTQSDAHKITSQTYNYAKEAYEYYDKIDKHTKKR